MAEVILDKVEKRFGDVKAVAGIDLTIADREFVILVGPSGCGKTTTLRMIAGLEELTTGDIRISGKSVVHLPPRDRDIAMVFQSYALYPHMTVFRNMAFSLQLRGMKKPDIAARVGEVADILGIRDLLDRKPRQLSGGQRQRVAVGAALCRQAGVLLFDEPLSNLDAKLRVHMRTELKRLHHTVHSTMIYVTHDQVEAMTMGDRIVIMNLGVIRQVGTPYEVYNHPADRFVASFIGTPPMNFFDAELEDAAAGSVIVAGGMRLPLPRTVAPGPSGRRVTFGIRPEHISLTRNGRAASVAVPSTIDIVEPLGREVIATASNAGGSFQLVADMDAGINRLDQVELHFDMSRAYVFDRDNECAR